MKEFLTALQETLQAAAGTGGSLAAVTADRIYLHRAAPGKPLPSIIVLPGSPYKTPLGEGLNYQCATFRAAVNIYVKLNTGQIGTAADQAMSLANSVERILLANPTLICATYGSGVVRAGDEPLKITAVELIDGAILPGDGTDGQECFLASVGVEAELTIADGVPTV